MLSSLTGVDLPAAADLCTRVPTCIRTEMGDVSSCLTRIIWSRDEKGIAKPASHEYSKHTECSRDGDHLVKRIEELPKTILELDEADSVSSSICPASFVWRERKNRKQSSAKSTHWWKNT
eukprot:Selendium_serpulae@DN6159_c2_g1_i16.p2